jgi:hypothetical protein
MSSRSAGSWRAPAARAPDAAPGHVGAAAAQPTARGAALPLYLLDTPSPCPLGACYQRSCRPRPCPPPPCLDLHTAKTPLPPASAPARGRLGPTRRSPTRPQPHAAPLPQAGPMPLLLVGRVLKGPAGRCKGKARERKGVRAFGRRSCERGAAAAPRRRGPIYKKDLSPHLGLLLGGGGGGAQHCKRRAVARRPAAGARCLDCTRARACSPAVAAQPVSAAARMGCCLRKKGCLEGVAAAGGGGGGGVGPLARMCLNACLLAEAGAAASPPPPPPPPPPAAGGGGAGVPAAAGEAGAAPAAPQGALPGRGVPQEESTDWIWAPDTRAARARGLDSMRDSVAERTSGEHKQLASWPEPASSPLACGIRGVRGGRGLRGVGKGLRGLAPWRLQGAPAGPLHGPHARARTWLQHWEEGPLWHACSLRCRRGRCRGD